MVAVSSFDCSDNGTWKNPDTASYRANTLDSGLILCLTSVTVRSGITGRFTYWLIY